MGQNPLDIEATASGMALSAGLSGALTCDVIRPFQVHRSVDTAFHIEPVASEPCAKWLSKYMSQLSLPQRMIGHHLCQKAIKFRSVIGVRNVANFVGDDVVNERHRNLHQHVIQHQAVRRRYIATG